MNRLYIHTEDVHNLNAPREVVPIILDLTKPKSVLDVGCGIGTWLKAFEEHGIVDYLGIDGDYVNKDLLKIPFHNFISQDLRTPWSLNRKFDLVISLEVAEHLPEENADLFVKTLSDHGNTILFSAAIPKQGGQNHLNEQWPEYWEQKFKRHGLYFNDVIRGLIWNSEKVEWWYRQNIFLITKNRPTESFLPLVHPKCFQHQIQILENFNQSILTGQLGIFESLKIFIRSIRSFKIF